MENQAGRGRRPVRLALIVLGAAVVLCAVGVKLALRISAPVYVPYRDDRPAKPISKDLPPYALPAGVAAALGETESLEIHLVGVRPRPAGLPEGAPVPQLPADRIFRDSEIFGTTRVSSPEQVEAVVASLLRGVENAQDEAIGCFLPRHGVRAKLRDGRNIDLSICFYCQNMKIYVPGQPVELVYTFADSRDRLNGALQAAGVDLEQEVASFMPPAAPRAALP
jgi:hypothetical protein